MKKLLIKALQATPFIIAGLGFFLMIGAAGSADLGLPSEEWLPPFLVGAALFGGVALVSFVLYKFKS